MKQTNLFSCIVAAVLTFAAASCSDEPNGGSHGLSGRKVAFSTKMSSDGNTKKVYLDSDHQGESTISVLWGSSDQVKIYSPKEGGGQQIGVYTAAQISENKINATLTHSGGDAIVWLEGGTQSFYSVLGSNGSIDGNFKMNLTIPATQDGTVATISQSNSAAVAFGSKKDVSVGAENVVLDYTLVPGVIRLTIPQGAEITSVTFSNADPDNPLSGTISDYTGSNDVVTNGGNITVTKTINPEGTPEAGAGATTTIDVYTLPLEFAKLAITVSSLAGSCTKTLSTTVAAGAVKAVSFGSYTLRQEFVMQVKAGGTYQLANKWTGDVKYSVSGSTSASGTLTGSSSTAEISLSQGDIVRVWESQPNVTFRSWDSVYGPLIRATNAIEPENVALISMPPMSCFTTDDTGKTAGDYFFNAFNDNGALTSLPAGSFDMSEITTVGNNFFTGFNIYAPLTELPVGSFNTSNITTVHDYFFSYFNYSGNLTSLPAGSFNTSNIKTIGNNFFNNFNYYGELTSLPSDSFDTSGITVNNYSDFFDLFNDEGKLEKGSSGDIVITNKSNTDITAYYWNGNGSDEENVPANGGTMIYKKQPSELPPSPVSTQAGISPKEAVQEQM